MEFLGERRGQRGGTAGVPQRAGGVAVVWRGPYIKGPADAPLLVSEKAYRVGE